MLNPPQSQRKAAESIYVSSVSLVANVLAFIVAFLGTGPVYSSSVGWIRDFTVSQYGPAFADIASLIWFAAVGLSVFGVARASLATAITLGGLALASRIF